MMSIMLCTKWVLCRHFRRSRVGVRKYYCPACGRSDGHGIGVRNWYSVCGTMVYVVVSTNNVESNFGNTRDESRKVPRSCEHGDCVRDLEILWMGAHTEVVHVDNRSWGFCARQIQSWDMNKDLGGWEMGGRPEILHFDDDDDDDDHHDSDECSDE